MAHPESNVIEWGRVFAEAIVLARKVNKRDADEIVHEGLALLFAGRAPPDPDGTETLAEHLVSVGRSALRNRRRVDRRRSHPRVVGKLVRAFDHPPSTPEDDLSEAQERARRFERLLVDFASDAEAREIILLEQEGVHDALTQAGQSGMTIEVVRNARKRIKRRVETIAEPDQEEAVKA
jgi:DNA-directed RNA polymerase specialized sigma24 family protein